jgi:hypothetical protein
VNNRKTENLPSKIKLVDRWEKMETGYCLAENLSGMELNTLPMGVVNDVTLKELQPTALSSTSARDSLLIF